jgi:hypothetical protein
MKGKGGKVERWIYGKAERWEWWKGRKARAERDKRKGKISKKGKEEGEGGRIKERMGKEKKKDT